MIIITLFVLFFFGSKHKLSQPQVLCVVSLLKYFNWHSERFLEVMLRENTPLA